MKLLFIIFFFCVAGNGFNAEGLDLLDKLENVIQDKNDLKNTEDISDSIKDLLDESAEKNNKDNFRSMVGSIHDELANNKTNSYSEKNKFINSVSGGNENFGNNFQGSNRNFKSNSNLRNGQNFYPNQNTVNKNNQEKVNLAPVDPYELTLKIMQYSKDKKKKTNFFMGNLNKNTGYLATSKPTNSEIIFDHIYINTNGDKKLPNSESDFVYDQLKNEFVVPEDGKIIYLFLHS
jgi:hypothetical protein